MEYFRWLANLLWMRGTDMGTDMGADAAQALAKRYCHRCNEFLDASKFYARGGALCKVHRRAVERADGKTDPVSVGVMRYVLRDKAAYGKRDVKLTVSDVSNVLATTLGGDMSTWGHVRIAPLDPLQPVSMGNLVVVTAEARRVLVKAWKANGVAGHETVLANLGPDRLK